MKTKINLFRALIATVLLVAGLTKASAKIDPSHHVQIGSDKIGSDHQGFLPCDGCVLPCEDFDASK